MTLEYSLQSKGSLDSCPLKFRSYSNKQPLRVAFLIVFDGLVKSICGQVGTVHLLCREPVKGLCNSGVGQLEGLVDGFADGHLG